MIAPPGGRGDAGCVPLRWPITGRGGGAAAPTFLRVRTVERHTANAYAMIGVHGRAAATADVLADLRGGARLESASIVDARGERTPVAACAVFAMIGADPRTEWLQGTVDLDAKGFVLTGSTVAVARSGAEPSPFQTSQAGIFAVGDVRSGSVKRAASAVGEGSVVVQAVHRYLASPAVTP